MSTMYTRLAIPLTVTGFFLSAPVQADSVFFSTGDPTDLIGTASRPASAGKVEIELADDFVLTGETAITSATFTGLLPTGAPLSDVKEVVVEIYRVFPKDSNTDRTPNVTHTGQFSLGCRIGGPRFGEWRPDFHPGVISEQLHRQQLCPKRHQSLDPNPPASLPAARALSRDKRSSSTFSLPRRSFCRPTIISSCRRWSLPTAISSGCRRRSRSFRRGRSSRPDLPTFRAGYAMATLIRIGCASARTSLTRVHSTRPSRCQAPPCPSPQPGR